MIKKTVILFNLYTRPVETFDPDVQDTKKPALELLQVGWSKEI